MNNTSNVILIEIKYLYFYFTIITIIYVLSKLVPPKRKLENFIHFSCKNKLMLLPNNMVELFNRKH